MANIPLRKYTNEIARLVDKGQNDEAIAHCRHILNTYPKHIQTYRLLGKAFLESQRYGDAADIFQRVLSAVPDDFVSHVGMSIIREDENDLDAATWHMERAYEVQPYNSAIQGELRRLYGRKDGEEPRKIPLTRGALARMYAKGDLYQQAIAELRSALAEYPHRNDLQVLLARMYFLTDQRIEAVETCSALLKKLPFCLEANRILAAILPETDRKEDSAVYEQRIQALDPYMAIASPYATTGDDVPETAVMVEKLDWQAGQAASTTTPAWAASLGVSFKPFGAEEEKMPEWMAGEEGTGEITSAPQAVEEQTEAGPAADIPDWMTSAGWRPSTGEGQADEAAGIFGQDTEDSDVTGEIAPAEIPDWLQGMAPKDEVEELSPGDEQDLLPWLQEEPPGPLDTVATWLEETKNAGRTAAEEDNLVSDQEASQEDIPDWLKEIGADITGEPISEVGISVGPGDRPEAGEDVPDWLKDVGEPEAVSSGEKVPEWLKELGEEVKPGEEEDFTGSETGVSGETGEAVEMRAAVYDWPGEIHPSTEGTPAADLMETPAGEIEVPSAEASLPAETEIPDELRMVEAESAAAEEAPSESVEALGVEGEILAWQEGTPGEVVAEHLEGMSEVVEPEAGEPELPDWLAEADNMVDETEPAVEAEIPDWLREVEPSAEAEVAQVDQSIEAVEAELPDWLVEAEAETGETSEQMQELESTPAVSDDDRMEAAAAVTWLANQAESDIEAEPLGESEVPDWLAAEEAAVDETSQPGVPGEGEPSPILRTETAEWLVEAEVEARAWEPSESAEEFPDWLKETSADQEAPAGPGEEQPAAASELADTQPVSIKRQQVEEPAVPVEASAETEKAVDEEIPDWLRAEEVESISEAAEMPTEEAVEAVEELPAETALPLQAEVTAEQSVQTPDFDLTDTDAALAWLESLAAKQGVPEEELITTPEERRETPPDWVKDLAESEVPPTQEQAEVEGELEEIELPVDQDLPGWLQAAEAEVDSLMAESPSEAGLLQEDSVSTGEAVPAAPDFDLTDTDAALAWLESLAAKQGVPEEELITTPEERRETPPDWVKDISGKMAEVVEEPVTEQAEPHFKGEVEWLAESQASVEAADDLQPETFEEEPLISQAEVGEEITSAEVAEPELPAWLEESDTAGAEEDTVWNPPETVEEAGEPAPRAARRSTSRLPVKPETPVNINTASLVEIENMPGVGFILAQNIIGFRETFGPFSRLEELVKVPGISSSVLEEIRPYLTIDQPEAVEAPDQPVVQASELPDVEVADGDRAAQSKAHHAVLSDQIPEAVEIYRGLIQREVLLEEIVEDLQDLLNKRPAEFWLWQTLGDAYVRDNNLQAALDAYIKAEELLR